MLKGSNVQGVVSPSTVIAKLEMKSDESVPVYACVWGAVLELNHDLTPQVLAQDPLLRKRFTRESYLFFLERLVSMSVVGRPFSKEWSR
jgi:hypothetical protein